jgi:hypothetical protein
LMAFIAWMYRNKDCGQYTTTKRFEQK